MRNKRQHIALGLAVIIVLFIGAYALTVPEKAVAPQAEKVSVTASFYPLAEFARQVGGAHVDVQALIPAGVEPHDFEPAPRQIATVYESDLFLVNGGGVDAWAVRLIPSVAEKGVKTLEMDTLVTDLLSPTEIEEEEEEEGHEAELFDEHFWLSPTLAKRQVEAIRDALAEIDPVHAEEYGKNAFAFTAELEALDQEYRADLTSCDIRVAVTSHAAFAYLARDYDFEQLPITGLSPDEEPSAGALAKVAGLAKERGVKYVFFEILVSPELAQTVAREIGAQTLVFNPLEGLTEEELARGETYLTVMRANLEHLRTAMLCR